MRIPQARRQAGDTIVEVLICIAIVSTVLTGAFVVANRSTSGVQDSNEHSQAELQLQSQVESFKQYLANNAWSDTSTIKYCVKNSVSIVTDSDPACDVSFGGANYHSSFSYDLTHKAYVFSITWVGLNNTAAKETYVYRAYAG